MGYDFLPHEIPLVFNLIKRFEEPNEIQLQYANLINIINTHTGMCFRTLNREELKKCIELIAARKLVFRVLDISDIGSIMGTNHLPDGLEGYLRIHHVSGDGNCMLNCVIKGLGIDIEPNEIRQALAEYVTSCEKCIRWFVQSNYHDNIDNVTKTFTEKRNVLYNMIMRPNYWFEEFGLRFMEVKFGFIALVVNALKLDDGTEKWIITNARTPLLFGGMDKDGDKEPCEKYKVHQDTPLVILFRSNNSHYDLFYFDDGLDGIGTFHINDFNSGPILDHLNEQHFFERVG